MPLVVTGTIAAMTVASAMVVGPNDGDNLSWTDKWFHVLLISGAGTILVVLSLT